MSCFSETHRCGGSPPFVPFLLLSFNLVCARFTQCVNTQCRVCVLRITRSDKAIYIFRSDLSLYRRRCCRRSRRGPVAFVSRRKKHRAAPSLRSERFSGVNESDLESGDIRSRWLSSWEPQPWGTTQPRPRGLLSRRRWRLLLLSSSSSSSSSLSYFSHRRRCTIPPTRRDGIICL